ncbi:chalcone isomerase family protein [Vibrio agarivorans]|uniref:chalcone isomerase family protein n=1 Tax=Vibrio agarivorans TaxID=153622 RepID=UPI0022318F51|nr:chalcone isomerase family protein [Vibrio agarivorans]
MRYLAVLLTLAWSCLSVAQPASLQPDLSAVEQWKRVGSADLDWLFFDVYQSNLFTPDGQYRLSHDVSPHPLALTIIYERSISSSQLVEATQDQWQKMGFKSSHFEDWLAQLKTIFPDVNEGDSLMYVSDGEAGVFKFKRSGSERWISVGKIDDENFSDAFLSIWLSSKTQYPKLRRQLIGMNMDMNTNRNN